MTATLFEQLQDQLNRDSLAFLPELILCGAIVLMLLLRLFATFRQPASGLGRPGADRLRLRHELSAVARRRCLRRSAPCTTARRMNIFSGMLVLRQLHHLSAAVPAQLHLPGHPADADDRHPRQGRLGRFLLPAARLGIGMSVMASANHLLMVLLGVEMASLPSYAMAGFLKGRRQSSEAALKYVVYGGGGGGRHALRHQSAGGALRHRLSAGAGRHINNHGIDPLVLLGSLFILIGICFKLAAVPFHFWCPDVFEGAAAEVGAFLSVASKGAALALLARLVLGLGGLGAIHPTPEMWTKSVRIWCRSSPSWPP